jgi:hypothetical protein
MCFKSCFLETNINPLSRWWDLRVVYENLQETYPADYMATLLPTNEEELTSS